MLIGGIPVDLIGLAPLVLLGVAFYFLLIRPSRKRRYTADRVAEIQTWHDANVLIAKDPDSELSVLRGMLAMENPHDDMFFARLAVLRALSQNPTLPVELQAAAINRVSQEEAAGRVDNSLKEIRKMSGGSKGSQGFIGFSSEI